MECKIEQGIDLSGREKRFSSKDYPFAELQVGQRFFVEAGKYEPKRFSVMCNSVGKRLGVRFSNKSDPEKGGVWCHRVS